MLKRKELFDQIFDEVKLEEIEEIEAGSTGRKNLYCMTLYALCTGITDCGPWATSDEACRRYSRYC